MKLLIFILCFIVIISVTLLDIYLTVKYCVNILDYEENPIARKLIEADGNNPALLVTIKALGLTLASWILILVYRWKRKIGLTIAIVVSIFQLWLFSYLLYSEPYIC